MQACLTDEMTGGNYKEQHPGAALPVPPRPVWRCVLMTGTWSWRRWRPASSSIWSSWYKFVKGLQCDQQEEVWCDKKNAQYSLLHYLIIWQLSGSVFSDQISVLMWCVGDQQRQQEGRADIDCECQCIIREIPGPADRCVVVHSFYPLPLSWTLLKR